MLVAEGTLCDELGGPSQDPPQFFVTNTGIVQFDELLHNDAGISDVIELCSAAGQGKTQVALAACAAHAMQYPESTVLYIAAKSVDVELRLRQYVFDTLRNQLAALLQEANGGTTEWEDIILKSFPSAACNSAQCLLNDDEDALRQLRASPAEQAEHPPWLRRRVAERLRSNPASTISYETSAVLSQILVVPVFTLREAMEVVEEAISAVDSGVKPSAASCACAGLAAPAPFRHRRPLPSTPPTVDARLSLLVADDLPLVIGTALNGPHDTNMVGYGMLMRLGYALKICASLMHGRVVVTNCVKRSWDGIGLEQGMESRAPAEEMDDDEEGGRRMGTGLRRGGESLLPAFTPTLSSLWRGAINTRLYLVSPTDVLLARIAPYVVSTGSDGHAIGLVDADVEREGGRKECSDLSGKVEVSMEDVRLSLHDPCLRGVVPDSASAGKGWSFRRGVLMWSIPGPGEGEAGLIL